MKAPRGLAESTPSPWVPTGACADTARMAQGWPEPCASNWESNCATYAYSSSCRGRRRAGRGHAMRARGMPAPGIDQSDRRKTQRACRAARWHLSARSTFGFVHGHGDIACGARGDGPDRELLSAGHEPERSFSYFPFAPRSPSSALRHHLHRPAHALDAGWRYRRRALREWHVDVVAPRRVVVRNLVSTPRALGSNARGFAATHGLNSLRDLNSRSSRNAIRNNDVSRRCRSNIRVRFRL